VRSPYFYSWKGGYKLYIEIYPQGTGGAEGTHLSIFVRESNQRIFDWGWYELDIVLLSQQEDKENRVRSCNTVGLLPGLPIKEVSKRWGFSNFITLEELENSPYLKNDKIFIQVKCKFN